MSAIDVNRTHLIAWLRDARNKAKDVAAMELATLLGDIDGRPENGGPASEEKGVTWVSVATANLKEIQKRLRPLGYCARVEALVPVHDASSDALVRKWKKQTFHSVEVYNEHDSAFTDMNPDRREFLFEQKDGQVKRIRGYRGSPGVLEHRALPVVDARVLVNLGGRSNGAARLLDPFAGAGGVALAAKQALWHTTTCDVDPALRHGLSEFADQHEVADVRELPFANESFDAIATEPPYDKSAWDAVATSLHEFQRVLKPDARASLLIAEAQREMLHDAARDAGLIWKFEAPVSRKGTNTTVVVLKKPAT